MARNTITTSNAPRCALDERESTTEARVGVSNSPSADTGVRPSGIYEAGVDTFRELFSIDSKHDLRLAAEVCGSSRIAPEEVAGARLGFIPGHELLWMEGRAAPALGRDELLPPDELVDVHAERVKALRSLGFWGPREEGVSRLDATVGLEFPDRSEGFAVLYGIAALDVPHRKPAIYGRPPETVYLLTYSGTKSERVYDKGLESSTAPRGTHLRFEAQVRFQSGHRRRASEWKAGDVRNRFGMKFGAMSAAANGVTVATERGIAEKLAQYERDGKLTDRQAELLMGHLLAERVGLRRNPRARRRRRAELRRLGLAQALDGVDNGVEVDLGAVLEDALTTGAWDA